MNERIIAKLGEVRYLVSQIVVEEEDDEERKSSLIEGNRESDKSQIDNKAGPFLRILLDCRNICLEYLKIFNDVKYWTNLIRTIER